MSALERVLSDVGAVVVQGGTGLTTARVEHVCASDLMSDVLVQERDDMLLVTSLAAVQALRTADIIGAVGVLLVNGKKVTESMTALARELDVTLAVTNADMFHACIRLGRTLGVEP